MFEFTFSNLVRFRGFIRVKSWKTLTTTMIPRRRTKYEVQIIETNFGRLVDFGRTGVVLKLQS